MKNVLCVLTLLAAMFVTACGDTDSKKKKPDDGGGDLSDSMSVIDPHVIYGDDNRKDLFMVTSPSWMERSLATVALIDSSDISFKRENGKSVAKIATRPFATRFKTPLCQSEKFRDQFVAPFCSGFLVSLDTVVTAGHCVSSSFDCKTTKYVFGYNMRTAGVHPAQVPASQVYSCVNLLRSKVDGEGEDYAVLKLDRPVEGVKPLRLRRAGRANVGDNVTVIGHPSGLPTKFADGGIVRKLQNGYMIASTDTYGGNSGSAVFNSNNGRVEGILVRGETDYVKKGNCLVSKKCQQNGCRGEDITEIKAVLDLVPIDEI
jgi:V8-like Glu-specific endopeptidase